MNDQNKNISASAKHKRNLLIVLCLSGTYMIAEVIGGLATKSLALLADAAHMLTDVVGLFLAFIAIKIGERKADAQKTFGYYRTEILAAVINAVVLLGISVYVLFEAWQRFKNPPEVQSTAMMIVAGIGLLVNIIGIMIIRKDSGESLNMKGAYFEVLSDALTSVGVMIAGVIMLTTGWYYADPLISAVIGLLIFPRTWKLLKEAVNVLLEGTPKDVNIEELRNSLESVKGVIKLHDLHVWSLTSGVNAMSSHVVADHQEDLNKLLKNLSDKATSEFKISHTTFQIETEGHQEGEVHL
ncbi:MAG: cation transporter [Chlorobi bacterium]|jgi:cobalt-zinc-cadmium efflux system protein|uniref:Cation transporter n=6 Tax=Chryseobacterium group TaxID=2782232 RepID=A0A1H6L1M9_9FLAO|nr:MULTISPECIES: cation diffusion facilitator family transporter [Chryseobacterium group]NPA10382.1 cation transporter [Chlorobiota bacterium]OJX32067.1 MAG: cation transporter [Chryseobacterium sp. 36-9]EFK33243.1 cation diffusion facilitator family transporter [Chryseobacterium gleum ATCC 35910]MDN4013332.1 cation diffusion facilitator family transporter [Chryseobacterium gambrini]MDN4028814.1 cation diffusion facilitator family transporter [Chryseobacterium gambrini]